MLNRVLGVMRNAARMFAHTFRGSTWRTWVGLEDERDAFRRYKALRREEREYVTEPSGSVPAEPAVA